MLKRFAPLVPIALSALLAACATQAPQQPQMDLAHKPQQQPVEFIFDEEPVVEFSDDNAYELPSLADSILAHGLSLVGTRYRMGGTSVTSGFDCSGFVGFLFKEEAGMQLPRSTRELINLDAPLVSRSELEPGDLIFFNNRGRGRVSHAGIYLGDDQFIHSSSSRSGGVRVDSLDDSYWSRSYMEAKRVLAMAPEPREAHR
ncbi:MULTISPECIES: NlpC/P60 family protein [unclassified Pseudomonas]|uniref:C40 family peptidase n=1 Tax=unclassified Pseudomonas TaxID=196821 RepID=UPI00244B41A9|nr:MULTISPECIES: NlpC/P60 family protein [unclassified Pseudomonas]MDG9931089.1 NlpC/P60 family protein [Pseudomonas sp. GD04042]MDH0485556.1 NlpC/P60 family protein [Pseudomonas sp. GD04015]MDH0606871.1 NlpC/P60 family protein [Pseudomonas sp. GD03869]